MAKQFTLTFEGKTADASEYLYKYLKDHIPEGFEALGDIGFTIYAANLFDPQFEKYMKRMSKALKAEGLPYVIVADDHYDVYEISKDGVYRIGGYEVVDLDPDGCGPIVEYRDCTRQMVG